MKYNKLFKVFREVTSNNIETLIFDLPDIISQENINKHKGLSTKIPKTSQYLGTGRFGFDIPEGVELDVIFPKSNPIAFIKTKAVLKWFSVNANIKTDYLPTGYSGICLIDFPEGKPELLKNLVEFGTDKYGKDYEELYLTTQAVMDKILKKM
ncbi:MAG: hypothetical protein ACK4FS_03510 [Flavobacterium sp.]